ncbi:MAG: cysteine desulfurase NifS [Clostridia bacterium]|nr:cysteine desulfurase NifS [Clostridia bacterium]
MNEIKYFDHAATTPLSREVLDAMMPWLTDNFGNASSVYSIGRTARAAVDEARAQVAKAINAKEKEIYFTAGGSEGDNTLIKGVAMAKRAKGNHIITSKIEHPAVLETCKQLEKEGFEVTYLEVNGEGKISIDDLKAAIKPETVLITIMFANNEIGSIQPIAEIGAIAREHKILFHTDAVQAVGNVPVDVKAMNIDLLSMSAHKFYGPKGVGAMYIRTGVVVDKLIAGGHQEKGKRAGTENVAGIVGMGKAIELACENMAENSARITELRDYYLAQVEEKVPYIRINSGKEGFLPGTANVSFKYIEGESLLFMLDMKGICASSGSACTSGSLDPSHVLLAIGVPVEVAHGSLRISIGKSNTKEDIDFLVDTLVNVVEKLRAMSPLYEDFLNGKYII